MSEGTETADVLIVGAGPAGLAAACELRRHGAGRVLVLDREREPGGIPRHCGHHPFGMREMNRVLRGPDYARRLVDRALGEGAEIRAATTVIALHPGGEVEVSDNSGPSRIRASRVLLATGVREKSRAARLIGGSKPGGVLSTGALQGLVHLESVRPFERPVILGSELVAFSALLTCRHAGIRPLAMIEPEATATARWPVPELARLLGVPIRYRHRIGCIQGRERVEAVEITGPDGTTETLATDGLIVTGDFVPEATLVLSGPLALDPATRGPAIDPWYRCSDPAFFAAGNLLRPVETAGWSWNEGRQAGRVIARALAGRLPAPVARATIRITGEPLKYAMPQILATMPDSETPPMTAVQLRVTRRTRGRLVARLEGRTILERTIDAAPERRILVPLSALPRGLSGEIELSVED
ncbi:MAG: FAD-dependent oxidoreductase [Geminicoccaceae bacterium]|nr:FAD-dependent oxidoreductase [Geminicoccaceae bacterium]